MLKRILLALIGLMLFSALAETAALTDEDCLALSNMVYGYRNFFEGMSVYDYWEDSWDRQWLYDDECTVTVGQMYENVRGYLVDRICADTENGFTAVVFSDENGRCVIVCAGASDFGNRDDEARRKEARADWFKNGVAIQVFHSVTENSQIESAIALYDELKASGKYTDIMVTGHSLGGALAYTVSAYSLCRGVTFNSLSAMTTVYTGYPEIMAAGFHGVDKWNFVEHINEMDFLTGQYGKNVKRYKEHYTNRTGSGMYFHGVESLVDLKTGLLMPVRSEYDPDSVISAGAGVLNSERLFLGTSAGETIDASGEGKKKTYVFAGGGDDTILTGTGADTVIPGYGSNLVEDAGGSDTYILLKDGGFTHITDASGQNRVVFSGYESSEGFVFSENGSGTEVYFEGVKIALIEGTQFAYSVNGETLK